MVVTKFSLIIMGGALSGILSGSVAMGDNAVIGVSDAQSAYFVAELISNGSVVVDPGSGRLELKKSVLSILNSHSVASDHAGSVAAPTNCSTDNCI